MDNQYVGEEQQTVQLAQSAHTLQKQERRLLERLREAQEAEARALERFQRAQAKLERRKARILRLEQRLSHLKEEVSTDAPASAGERFADYGDYSDDGEHHDEHTANGYVVIETQTQDASISPAPVTPIPAFEPEAITEIEEDTFEPEVHVTPELMPSSEASPEVEAEPVSPVAEDLVEPVEEVSQAAVTDEAEVIEAKESASTVSEPEAFVPAVEPVVEAIEEAQPVQEVHEIQPAQEVHEVHEVQVVSLKMLEQTLAEARETWQLASEHVKLAQERRDELAKSISFLAQANLSGALMDELLHKQAEANRYLVGAKEHERIAYERLARAEAAYQDAHP